MERQRKGEKEGQQETSDHQLYMPTPLLTHSPAVAAACLLREWGGGRGGWSQWRLCEGWTAAWCHVQPRRTISRHSSSALSSLECWSELERGTGREVRVQCICESGLLSTLSPTVSPSLSLSLPLCLPLPISSPHSLSEGLAL